MSNVPGPRQGVTVRAHVEGELVSARVVLETVENRIWSAERRGRRLSKSQREMMRRDLAGVQAACETVKCWLDAGAPE